MCRRYPRDLVLVDGRTFLEAYGPRGVLRCRADGRGGQTIEDTGPLTKKRMETVDEETLAAAKEFIQRQQRAGAPFFCWWNATRMHFRTHVKQEHRGNYIDGYNMLDYLSGKTDESPRKEFWYTGDEGQVVAARYNDWKVVFMENRANRLQIWKEPFVELRAPDLYNLRRDPFEKAKIGSNTYEDWYIDRAFIVIPIQGLAARFLKTMEDYPPSQMPGSWNLHAIEQKLKAGPGSR